MQHNIEYNLMTDFNVPVHTVKEVNGFLISLLFVLKSCDDFNLKQKKAGFFLLKENISICRHSVHMITKARLLNLQSLPPPNTDYYCFWSGKERR